MVAKMGERKNTAYSDYALPKTHRQATLFGSSTIEICRRLATLAVTITPVSQEGESPSRGALPTPTEVFTAMPLTFGFPEAIQAV